MTDYEQAYRDLRPAVEALAQEAEKVGHRGTCPIQPCDCWWSHGLYDAVNVVTALLASSATTEVEEPGQDNDKYPSKVGVREVGCVALGVASSHLDGEPVGGHVDEGVGLIHALQVCGSPSRAPQPSSAPATASEGATEARCGCTIGGLHRYACGLVGHVDPPRPTGGTSSDGDRGLTEEQYGALRRQFPGRLGDEVQSFVERILAARTAPPEGGRASAEGLPGQGGEQDQVEGSQLVSRLNRTGAGEPHSQTDSSEVDEGAGSGHIEVVRGHPEACSTVSGGRSSHPEAGTENSDTAVLASTEEDGRG